MEIARAASRVIETLDLIDSMGSLESLSKPREMSSISKPSISMDSAFSFCDIMFPGES